MIHFGIRREEKAGERRAPLTPAHIAELVREHGHSVAVQPSAARIFSDREYRASGATIREDLSDCAVILGVKEVDPLQLIPGKAYFFFSHTIKGQRENMPLLQKAIGLRCTLIDYEMILDRYGRRLIFFGRHAGYAGMVDALWAYGQRMLVEGVETAFASVKRAYEYRSVDHAAQHLSSTVGRRIRKEGIRHAIHPLVVGFTGGGNVSQGAQEILDRLPTVAIDPDELPDLARGESFSRHAVYKTVFRRDHRVNFARHLPFLSILVNGIYWEPGQPKLVTRADLQALFSGSTPPRLRMVADISCDVTGSIEATTHTTTPHDPVYAYDPLTGDWSAGQRQGNISVLAVDNLPTEFPRDATEHFGDSLFPFVDKLVSADYSVPFEHLVLPAAVLGAVVTHAGELAPRYRHLAEALREESR